MRAAIGPPWILLCRCILQKFIGQTFMISTTWHKHLTHSFWDMPLLIFVTSFKMVAIYLDHHYIWIFAENSFFVNNDGTYLLLYLDIVRGKLTKFYQEMIG